MASTEPPPDPGAGVIPQRSVRVVLSGLMIAMLLAMLDNMIVGKIGRAHV